MIPSTLALALCAITASSGAADLTVVIPSPKDATPGIERTLRWLSAAIPELDPARIAERSKQLAGVDLMSSRGREEMGIDASAPVVLHYVDQAGALVFVLPTKDSERASQIEAKRSPAAEVRLTRDAVWIALRVDDLTRSTLDVKSPRSGLARVLEQLAGSTAPKPNKELLVPRADLWWTASGREGVERIDGALAFHSKGFDARFEVSLATMSEVALLELVDAKRSVSLLGPSKLFPTAIDASLGLTPAGITRALTQIGAGNIPAPLDGSLHAALGKNGALVLAAGVSRKADEAALAKLVERLRVLKSRPKIELRDHPKGKLVVATLGDLSREQLDALVAAGDRKERKTLALGVYPPLVLDAARSRSAPKDGAGLRASDLLFLRFVLKPLLDATPSIAILGDASRAPRLRFTAQVEHR